MPAQFGYDGSREATLERSRKRSVAIDSAQFTPCPSKVLDVLRQLRAAGIQATWGRWDDSIEIRGYEIGKLLAVIDGEKLPPVEAPD